MTLFVLRFWRRRVRNFSVMKPVVLAMLTMLKMLYLLRRWLRLKGRVRKGRTECSLAVGGNEAALRCVLY